MMPTIMPSLPTMIAILLAVIGCCSLFMRDAGDNR
jgi:hypothetical protein